MAFSPDSSTPDETSTSRFCDHRHVVMAPFAGEGHVNPMFRFAKLLASHKHVLVSFAFPARYHALAVKRCSFDHLPESLRIYVVDDGLPTEEHVIPSFSENARSLIVTQNAVERLLSDLSARSSLPTWHDMHTSAVDSTETGSGRSKDEKLFSSGWPPVCCMISDTFVITQDMADRFGIRRVDFWTGSASVYTMLIHLPEVMSRGLLPLPSGTANKWNIESPLIDFIPGLSSCHIADFPRKLIESYNASDEFVRFILKAFSCVKKADWILVNSFYELESRVYDAMQMLGYPIYGIGPLMKMESESNSLGSECLDWLSQQKPASVIYVAFGSLAKLKTKDMESLALGLQASGLPFLWVIPLESISAMNNSGFASPNGFRDWIASLGLGFITSWAPQREVLGHSAVGAFVSHCGWNSVMESLCEAVPIVACPQGADQIGNARTIAEHLKVGVEIKREDDGSFTKESVQRAIKEIMKNEEARKRIAHLKQVIRDSTTWGSSYFNITKFIDYLFQLHCPCHS